MDVFLAPIEWEPANRGGKGNGISIHVYEYLYSLCLLNFVFHCSIVTFYKNLISLVIIWWESIILQYSSVH